MILYRTDFLLHVRIATRDGDPPPEIILRHLLKRMWRALGVKCVAVAPADGQGPPTLASGPRSPPPAAPAPTG